MNNRGQNRRNQGGYYDLDPIIYASEAPVVDPPAPAPNFAPPEDMPPPPPAHWGQPVPDAAGSSGGNQVNELPRAKSGRKAAPQPEVDVPEADPPPTAPQVIYQEPPQQSSKGKEKQRGSDTAPQQPQQAYYPPQQPTPQSYGAGYAYPGAAGGGWIRRLTGWFFQDSNTGHPGLGDHQPVWMQIGMIVGGVLFWIWGAMLTQRYIYTIFPGLKNVSTGTVPLVELFPASGKGFWGIVDFHLTDDWMTTLAVFALSGLISFVEFMIFKRQSTRAKRFFILAVFGFDVYMNVVAYIDLFKYTPQYGKSFKWIPFFPKKDEAFEAGSFGIWLTAIGTAVMPEIMLSRGTTPARAYVQQAARQQGQGRRR